MSRQIKIIIFAKETSGREFLKNMLGCISEHIVSFESEAICFDNLKTIQPNLIVLKTEEEQVVWRFVFALHVLMRNTQLILISDSLKESKFRFQHPELSIQCVKPAADVGAVRAHISFDFEEQHKHNVSAVNELLVGASSPIRSINDRLPALKRSSETILITGEPGTGKELLARLIADHQGSDATFIKIDCSQFSGLPDAGHRRPEPKYTLNLCALLETDLIFNKPATILLDKVHCLGRISQSEILHFMDETSKPVHQNRTVGSPCIRFIATSERNISNQVKSGRFRKALYYRLNVIPLFVPALKHRKEDIPVITDWLLLSHSARLKRSFLTLSTLAMDRLWAYHWPGNVDELERLIERIVLTGDERHIFAHTGNGAESGHTIDRIPQMVRAEMLPKTNEIQNCLSDLGKSSLKSICDQFVWRTEKNLLRMALETTNWNRKRAADLLNISYKSMLNKMKIYEIV